jgi:hypothetical protein
MAKWNGRQGIAVLIASLNLEIRNWLKILLEEKHLYQKVVIDADAIVKKIRAEVVSAYLPEFDEQVQKTLGSVLLSGQMDATIEAYYQREFSTFRPENVKLFCAACDRREAFSPLWQTDATYQEAKSREVPGKLAELPQVVQLYLIVYRCESCLKVLDTILIRRDEWQFSLHGRSPMEKLEIPEYIPKAEKRWFRDALIANHAGKTLAGLFYLRTFIEQFARRLTGHLNDKITGDVIMTEYADTLPMKQRDEMPSLRDWYDKLSAKLHRADEDAELFEEARKEIERHFDFRRVFKMDDRQITAGAVAKTADAAAIVPTPAAKSQ